MYVLKQVRKDLGGTCQRINSLEAQEYPDMAAENVVFVFQMPLPKHGMHLAFSRWQQNLIGVLSLDIEYEEEVRVFIIFYHSSFLFLPVVYFT